MLPFLTTSKQHTVTTLLRVLSSSIGYGTVCCPRNETIRFAIINETLTQILIKHEGFLIHPSPEASKRAITKFLLNCQHVWTSTNHRRVRFDVSQSEFTFGAIVLMFVFSCIWRIMRTRTVLLTEYYFFNSF